MQQKSLAIVPVVLSVLVLAGVVWLGISNWQLKNELDELKQQQSLVTPGTSQRGDPMDPFYSMQKRMDEMMQSFSSGSFFNGPDRFFATAQPAISMRESKDRYQVVIEIPDGQNVELNTDLDENRLWISGEVQSKQNQSSARGQIDVSNLSRFSRSFYFPEDIDPAGMHTEESDEEITITIPKK